MIQVKLKRDLIPANPDLHSIEPFAELVHSHLVSCLCSLLVAVEAVEEGRVAEATVKVPQDLNITESRL